MTMAQQQDREAAFWVERMSGPAPAPDVARAFDTWIMADPDNVARFGRMRALWESDAIVQALSEVAWQRPRPHPVREALDWMIAFLRRPLTLGAGAALACAVAAALLLPRVIVDRSFEARPGPVQRIALADGTQVTLSGGSRLTVHITPWSRSATLEKGEAFFDVAHERWRRFAVASAGKQILVLGTAFDVDRQGGDAVAVRVYRGLVGVEAADGSAWRLPAGTAIRIVGNRGRRLPAPFGDAPGWLGGWYETEEAPMQRQPLFGKAGAAGRSRAGDHSRQRPVPGVGSKDGAGSAGGDA
jgi:transmembrane sensor